MREARHGAILLPWDKGEIVNSDMNRQSKREEPFIKHGQK